MTGCRNSDFTKESRIVVRFREGGQDTPQLDSYTLSQNLVRILQNQMPHSNISSPSGIEGGSKRKLTAVNTQISVPQSYPRKTNSTASPVSNPSCVLEISEKETAPGNDSDWDRTIISPQIRSRCDRLTSFPPPRPQELLFRKAHGLEPQHSHRHGKSIRAMGTCREPACMRYTHAAGHMLHSAPSCPLHLQRQTWH